MMTACRSLMRSQSLLCLNQRVVSYYSTKAALLAEQMIHYNKKLPHRIELKEQKNPFAKNLLLGIYDFDVLAFPEAQSSSRNKEFLKWLKPVEDFMKTVDARAIDNNRDIPSDVIDKLNEFGVFAAYIHEDFGGLGLLESEYMKLLETLSKVPAIALFLIKINKCVEFLTKHASPEQKMNYLPRIANGSLIPTYLLSEPKTNDVKQIQTMGLLTDDDTHYVLRGQKIFVPYINKANLFIIFSLAGYNRDLYSIDKTLSVFVIEKDSQTMQVSEPINTSGIRGLPHFNVQLVDFKVPVDSMIGNVGQGIDMYSEFVSSRKVDSGAVAIGILKNFIESLIHHMTHTKHFNKKLFEFDTAKEVLGKACHTLYAMESATYMATLLMDLHSNQDCLMESAIVQTYCSSECIKQISEGIHLIGTPAYLTDNNYDLYFRDAHSLTVFENSVIDNETFVSLVGLQHLGKQLKDDVRKLRNLFDFPLFSFFYGKKYLNLRVRDYLHPNLMEPAKQLEIILYSLKSAALNMLIEDGSEVSDNHMNLRRLYEMSAIAYVFSSILARSSRSYCNGMKHAESEMQMAHTFSFKMVNRVKMLEIELNNEQWKNGDINYKEISNIALKEKEYHAEHPLKRNF